MNVNYIWLEYTSQIPLMYRTSKEMFWEELTGTSFVLKIKRWILSPLEFNIKETARWYSLTIFNASSWHCTADIYFPWWFDSFFPVCPRKPVNHVSLFLLLWFSGQEAGRVESSAQLLARRACEFRPWATAHTVLVVSCRSYGIRFLIP